MPYSAISESDILKIRAEAASAANNGHLSTTSSSNKSARCSKGDTNDSKTKNLASKGASGNKSSTVKTLKSKKPNGIHKRPVGRPPSGKTTPSRVWVNYATDFKAKTTPTTVLSPTKI